MGAFHFTKSSGNFGQIKSNGNIHFGLVQLEYSEPQHEVVHFDWLDQLEWNLPFHFDKLIDFPALLQWISLMLGIGESDRES